MRIANLSGRLVVVTGEPGHEIAYDVEKNGSGRFGAGPQAIYETWDVGRHPAAVQPGQIPARFRAGRTVAGYPRRTG